MLKVSYLIGLYNKDEYIIECIESILNEQSNNLDIEICIVDDGSTDDSYKIIKEKYKNCLNVKIHQFTENKGKNSAYNYAFKMATGSYVCIFGADDIVVSGRTQLMLKECIEKNKAIYGGILIKNSNFSVEIGRQSPQLPNLYSISMFNYLSGGAVMLPKNIGEQIFPIPENLKFEDWWISYNLVKDNLVDIIANYVTIYRISDSNDCASKDESFEEYYTSKIKDFSRHFDYIEEFIKTDQYNKYLLKSLDIRNLVFKIKPKKILYMPFDRYSFIILFMYLFGAKKMFRALYLKKKIKIYIKSRF